MTRQDIGASLAARLYSAESALDRAMAETAGLAAALPDARAGAWLSAVTGQRAFTGTAAAISALAEARGHLVQTHNTLAALARKLGLETLAAGPVDKPGDTPPIGGGVCPESDTTHYLVNKSLPTTAELC